MILTILGAVLTVKYAPYIVELAAEPDNLRRMLSAYGGIGILVFLMIQIVQVIIAFLPGDVTQIAGGYIYGTFMGSLYSMIGIAIGTAIVFFTARFLGHSLISLFVPKEMLEKFNFLINSPKAELAMFIIFLIPGMPKDLLSYVAGITPIKPVNFLTISLIARFPTLFVSSYIGANLQQGNVTAVIVITVISCILLGIGFCMKEKIFAFLHRGVTKSASNQ